MTTLIVHPDNDEQLDALKNFMIDSKISFEEEKSPYNVEFVAMIKQGEEDIKAGKGIKLDVKNLWK